MIENIQYFIGHREWRTVTMMRVELKQPKEALSFAHFARMAGKTRLCQLIVSAYHKLWELRS
ncbi:hypothetical protein JCM19237_272 [Photobacterium aphoticum]|uniref:Uncharacterized protein n=1 Tax=Photobacterium aphoticum TaxID=754436 RepID=A0A090RK70_9GAMM|nr:hypothetical protein JCM19237_272 [Photobacterium aphoticum]